MKCDTCGQRAWDRTKSAAHSRVIHRQQSKDIIQFMNSQYFFFIASLHYLPGTRTHRSRIVSPSTSVRFTVKIIANLLHYEPPRREERPHARNSTVLVQQLTAVGTQRSCLGLLRRSAACAFSRLDSHSCGRATYRANRLVEESKHVLRRRESCARVRRMPGAYSAGTAVF